MSEEISPVFKDTMDQEIEEKTKRIIDERLKEYTLRNVDDEKKKESQDKIKRIREYIDKKKNADRVDRVDETHDHTHEDHHVHDDVSCPTCKKHNLKIEGDVVKCTGPKCGEKFFMAKTVDEKRSHQCSNCGGAFTKSEIDKMTKTTDSSCPLCNKGVDMIPIDWDRFQYDVDEILKQIKKK